MTISTPFALKRNETTPFTRTFLDDIDAAAARTTLGLGNVENAAASGLYLPLTGGSLTGPLIVNSGVVGAVIRPSEVANAIRLGNSAGVLVGSNTNHAVDFVTNGYTRARINTSGAFSFLENLTVGSNADGRLFLQNAPAGWGNSYLVLRAGTIRGGIAGNQDDTGVALFSGASYTGSSNQFLATTSGCFVNNTDLIMSRGLSVTKSFTSATSFERLVIDPITSAAEYRIGSRIGSLGGTTRPINFGAYSAAGAWTQWLGLDASGAITMPNLPTSDPAVAGRLWRSGNDLKISTG